MELPPIRFDTGPMRVAAIACRQRHLRLRSRSINQTLIRTIASMLVRTSWPAMSSRGFILFLWQLHGNWNEVCAQLYNLVRIFFLSEPTDDFILKGLNALFEFRELG